RQLPGIENGSSSFEDVSKRSWPSVVSKVCDSLVLNLYKDFVGASSTLLLIFVCLDCIFNPTLSDDVVGRRHHLVLFDQPNNQRDELGNISIQFRRFWPPNKTQFD